jgi:hypothetical protein
MSNDRRIVPRSPSESSTIPNLLLEVTNDGPLWTLGDGEDVPDVQSRFPAAVDEGSGRETFGGDESLFAELVAIGVAEDYGREGSSAMVRSALSRRPQS